MKVNGNDLTFGTPYNEFHSNIPIRLEIAVRFMAGILANRDNWRPMKLTDLHKLALDNADYLIEEYNKRIPSDKDWKTV